MKMYKYERIAERLTQQIKRGEISHQLPTYREMVNRFAVSSRTVDQVIELLKSDGLIYSKPGKGLFVKPELQKKEGS